METTPEALCVVETTPGATTRRRAKVAGTDPQKEVTRLASVIENSSVHKALSNKRRANVLTDSPEFGVRSFGRTPKKCVCSPEAKQKKAATETTPALPAPETPGLYLPSDACGLDLCGCRILRAH